MKHNSDKGKKKKKAGKKQQIDLTRVSVAKSQGDDTFKPGQ